MGQTVERRGVDSAVLGMAIFLMVEAMFFAGLVSALVVGRVSAKGWPPAGQAKASPIAAVAATLILLASVAALRAARRSAASRSLSLAVALGGVFLLLQGWEGFRVLTGGSGLVANTYAGLLLMLVGCHAIHVLGGVALLARARLLWVTDASSSTQATRLRVCGMYWTFVVGVWPVIATAICA